MGCVDSGAGITKALRVDINYHSRSLQSQIRHKPCQSLLIVAFKTPCRQAAFVMAFNQEMEILFRGYLDIFRAMTGKKVLSGPPNCEV